jgi:iron complex transport system substrate-binding protein
MRGTVICPRVTRVFARHPRRAALHPAPDLLVGRNRLPEGEALEFFPPAYRTPTLIRQLPEVDNPAADAELVALKPHLYVDYGTVNADYVASLDAVQKRTGVPGVILDGALTRVPAAYRRLGAALGVPERGERLAAAAEGIFTKYRGTAAQPPVRVYLACSGDGFVPCLADDSGGEPLHCWAASMSWLANLGAAAPRTIERSSRWHRMR